MPYASDDQRRFLHAVHPEIARRWDAEERRKKAPTPVDHCLGLLAGGLVGVSDRSLRAHVELYVRAQSDLSALRSVRVEEPRDLSVPGLSPIEVRGLLDAPVASLPLAISGNLEEVIAELREEFRMKGLSWFPEFYLGDGDFWTADRSVSVNVPWYFADDALWALVNDHLYRYSEADVLRTLRHEAGHALGYAFELWRRPLWSAAFGDFLAPYEEDYSIDAASTDFVDYLQGTGTARIAHYGQKHPDEDWAETFAEWLDPGSRWREAYADRPGALAKLEAVERLIVGEGAAYGPAPNQHRGRRVPYTTLPYTVGAFLGEAPAGLSAEADAARGREAALAAKVELHRLHFQQMVRGGNPGAGGLLRWGGRLTEAVSRGGSWAAWLRDLRECARAADGWALACWDAAAGAVRNFCLPGDEAPPMPVLVALDAKEHAWMPDYGLRKDLGIAAQLENLDWSVVAARFDRADPPPVIIPLVLPSPVLPLPGLVDPTAGAVPAPILPPPRDPPLEVDASKPPVGP